MSLNEIPLKVFSVEEPRTEINNVRNYVALKGGKTITQQQFISTNYSNSQAQYSITVPSKQTYVDRKVKISVPFTVTLTGTTPAPTQNLLQSGYDAPRAFPISAVTNNLTVKIDNASTSIELASILGAIQWYRDSDKIRDGEDSLAPSVLDKSQNYSDLVLTNRNPLADYTDFNYGAGGRAGFPMTITTNNNTDAVITFTATESLYISPFLYGEKEESGLIGVSSINITQQFGDLTRAWSHAVGSGSVINSISVSIGQPSALVTFITPKELQPLPSIIPYPYSDIQRYPTDAGATTLSNASVTLQSGNIVLNSIPRRIWVFARRRDQDQTYLTTDTFASMDSISINWNNQSGLLAQATAQDLYRISRENGCQMSWPEWSGFTQTMIGSANTYIGTVGSVLCLEMGKDIGLDDLEAPGVLGNYNLLVRGTFTNPNQTSSVWYSLYVVVESEGTYNIVNGSSSFDLGVLSSQDVLNSKDSTKMSYSDLEAMGGGNFAEGLKKFAKKAYAIGKEIYKSPIAREAYKFAAPLVMKAISGAGAPQMTQAQARRVQKAMQSPSRRMPMVSRRQFGPASVYGGAINQGDAYDDTYEDNIGDDQDYETESQVQYEMAQPVNLYDQTGMRKLARSRLKLLQ